MQTFGRTRYIVFNGPPESGKSTASAYLSAFITSASHYPVANDSFAAPMKHYIAVCLGEKYSEMDKNKARPELNGYSVRQFLISESEDQMKRRYGPDIFGKLLAHRVLRLRPPPTFVIIDDNGFQSELDCLPKDRTFLVRMERKGKDFSKDSRSYLAKPYLVIPNNGPIFTLHRDLVNFGRDLIAQIGVE